MRRLGLVSERCSPPEASLKIDAIESGYAVPLIRLNLLVWCIDLSIRPRRSASEQGAWQSDPKATDVEIRIKHSTIAFGGRVTSRANPLLWAREASSRAIPIAFGER